MRGEAGTEYVGRGRPLLRAAALATFALSSAVAAVAAIVPFTDAELLLAKAAVLEPVAIRLDEALLPAPSTYVREDRLQRMHARQRHHHPPYAHRHSR